MLLWFYCSYDIEATEFYLDTIISNCDYFS